MRLGTRQSRAPSGVERVRSGVSISKNPASSSVLRISSTMRCRSSMLLCSFGRRKSSIPVAQARLFARRHFVLRSGTAASSTCSKSKATRAITSTSPDGNSGFPFCRFKTFPFTAITNSDRSSSAVLVRRRIDLRVEHNLRDPARSRRSIKINCPRSRRRCTQPINTTSLSASAARNAPQ